MILIKVVIMMMIMLGMMVKLLILVKRVDDTDKSGNNGDDYDVDDNNKDFDTRTLIQGLCIFQATEIGSSMNENIKKVSDKASCTK